EQLVTQEPGIGLAVIAEADKGKMILRQVADIAGPARKVSAVMVDQAVAEGLHHPPKTILSLLCREHLLPAVAIDHKGVLQGRHPAEEVSRRAIHSAHAGYDLLVEIAGSMLVVSIALEADGPFVRILKASCA